MGLSVVLRFAYLTIFPASVFAADTSSPGLSSSNYLQVSLALAAIVGLLLGLAWLAKKASGGRGFGQGGMKVIGGVALGPRERIVLVEVGDSWLVIGIVPGQIRTLHRLPKEPDSDAGGSGVGDEKPFANLLKTLAERRQNA